MTVGKIHSFQSLGTVDGPGVRAVLFMQGCPLRCVCCHNPDTWSMADGKDMSVDEAYNKIIRCKNYFGSDGGVTVSGGEPLMQPDFLIELFKKLKDENINIALDTSGYLLDEKIKEVLAYVDLVLLDYKYTNNKDYLKYTKCEKKNVDIFLKYLDNQNIDTWLRQVIIPELNDNKNSVSLLSDLKNEYKCIKKIELLPFRKLCIEKYKALNIQFPLENTPEAPTEVMDELNSIINI